MTTLQLNVGGPPEKENTPKRSFADMLAQSALSSLPTKAMDLSLSEGPSVDGNQVKPTTGTHKGLPAAFFAESSISNYAEPLRWVLIGKFSKGFNRDNPKLGRPPIELIEKFFVSLDLKGQPEVGLLDSHHIKIHLRNEEDFLRIYSKSSWHVEGKLMRIFKWSTSFHVEKESSVAPIWIRFPKLPLHFFNREALFTLGSLIGNPLRADVATAKLSRPSAARIQVEVDLLNKIPEKVWIGTGSNGGMWQNVEVEFLPPYCNHCWHVGHSEEGFAASTGSTYHHL